MPVYGRSQFVHRVDGRLPRLLQFGARVPTHQTQGLFGVVRQGRGANGTCIRHRLIEKGRSGLDFPGVIGALSQCFRYTCLKISVDLV